METENNSDNNFKRELVENHNNNSNSNTKTLRTTGIAMITTITTMTIYLSVIKQSAPRDVTLPYKHHGSQ